MLPQLGSQVSAARPTSSFFKLPPELRNVVYELVFSDWEAPEHIHACDLSATEHNKKCRQMRSEYIGPIMPAFSRTCRQVQAETLPLFYNARTLIVPYAADQATSQRLARTLNPVAK